MTLNPHKYKHLKVLEGKLSAKLQTAKTEAKVANAAVKKIGEELQGIRDQLTQGSNGVVLSEHGLLRFIEHVKGIDLSAIKKEILTPKIEEQIKTIGAGKIPCGDYTLVIKNNVIVTITPRLGRKKKFSEDEQNDIRGLYHKTKMTLGQVAHLYRTSTQTVDKIIMRKY